VRLNLILSVTWLIIGGGLLIYRQLHPEIHDTYADSFAFNGGIFGLVLAAYNLVRWWSSRALARHRAKSQPRPQRPKAATLEYNPEFDFNRQGPRMLGKNDGSGKE
jgi:hypothetical protein